MVESAPGKGSTFTVDLPVSIDDKRHQRLIGTQIITSEAPDEADRAQFVSPVARVLVVADDDALQSGVVDLLPAANYQVESVTAADRAVGDVRRLRPKLILLDLMMGGGQGLNVLNEIKSDPELSSIPVVVLTVGENDSQPTLAVGAEDYLPKNRLSESLSTVLGEHSGNRPASEHVLVAEDYVPKPFNSVVLRARISASLEKKRLRDQEQNYLERIKIEQKKSEKLLLTILPAAIASRLKSGERNIVDSVYAASVMFIDIVGFTAIASKTTPDHTVVLLNGLFSMFDGLVDTFGLEKIKTIGDAYMAVAGVPNAAEDHALRAARMGMAVQDTLKEFNQKHGVNWAVRVGLHRGEVMAGIIGSRKFAYYLRGDTVNLASRLESQGRAVWVQISAETANLIESEFDVSPVGLVDIRNRGELQVYRIAGPKHPGQK